MKRIIPALLLVFAQPVFASCKGLILLAGDTPKDLIQRFFNQNFDRLTRQEALSRIANERQKEVNRLIPAEVELADRLYTNDHELDEALLSKLLKLPTDAIETKEYLERLVSIEERLRIAQARNNFRGDINISPRSQTIDKSDFLFFVDKIPDLEWANFWKRNVKQWCERFLANQSVANAQKRKQDLMRVVRMMHDYASKPSHSLSFSTAQHFFDQIEDVFAYSYEKAPKSDRPSINSLPYDAMHALFRFSDSKPDPKVAERVIRLYKATQTLAHDTAEAERVWRVFRTYLERSTSLTSESEKGLTHKLLPALLQKDPQVKALSREGGWAAYQTSTGIANFAARCYTTEITPSSINDLLLNAREVTSTSYARFEQNRRDGLSLALFSEPLRECIHDQAPGVHDLVSAIIDFYDSHGAKREELALQLRKHQKYFDKADDRLFDLKRYEQSTADGTEDEKIIDVVRRVEKNTNPISESPPIVTGATNINARLSELETKLRMGGNPTTELKNAVDSVNSFLRKALRAKEIGIEPNTILAISWLEHQASQILQQLSYEKAWGVHRAPWFQSLLKFNELIASSNQFNSRDFNKFIQRLNHEDSPRFATRMILQRIAPELASFQKKYTREGKTNRIGMLMSGNLAHELMLQPIERIPDSVAGRRHRDEQRQLEWWLLEPSRRGGQ